MLVFYFFVGNQKNEDEEKSGLMASFFSAIAVSVKFSAVPILFIPLIVIAYQTQKRRFLSVFRICVLVALLLTPVIIRNVISTGYPLYPSSFAAIYSTDWKLEKFKVAGFQQYITAYARYPILMVNTAKEYSNSFLNWLPVWWEHLYIIDKAVIFFIVMGIFLNLFFIKNWKRVYSQWEMLAFIVTLSGSVLWFIKAPDPRFGTGFLLPLIYFLYLPFIRYMDFTMDRYINSLVIWIKNISIVFIILYVGYRAVYFFHPRQLILPDGVRNTSLSPPDCDAMLKKMVLSEEAVPGQLSDSCMFFRFRGTTIKQGFKPAQ
jgi:hypothetical protein